MSTQRVVGAIAVLLGLGLAAPGIEAATILGGDSPQAVVARMSKAAKSDDIGEMIACMEPDSRADATMAMVLGTTMMVAFMDMGSGMADNMAQGMDDAGAKMTPEDKAKFEKQKAAATAKAKKAKAALSAVLKKYGLPDFMDPKTPQPKKGSGKEMLAKVDQPALATDLNRLMDQFGDKDGKSHSTNKTPDPNDVTDYAFAGDHATAKSKNETIQFVKLDGRWFLEPPRKEAKSSMPGP
jgi:hypothetical protein